jgi:hypothetical protein
MDESDKTAAEQPAAIERPEDKDLQDHTFGQGMVERERRAEQGEPDPGEEREPHASGRA